MKSEEISDVILPEETSLYSHQVAGHEYDGNTKLGVLKHKNGAIIKPVMENGRSEKELLFYENVFCNKDSDSILSELSNYLPKFLGTCQTRIKDKEKKFLCLEDVCETFSKPSILDVKIGKVTYDPEATGTKIEYEKSKYLYSEVLGFRILGMKIYNYDEEKYVHKDKKFGKGITPENMKNALELFFTSNLFINCCILSGFLHKLNELENWFKHQRKFAFYSSSLLFVYEGMFTAWNKWIKTNLHNFCRLECQEKESSAISAECLRNIFIDNNSSNNLNCNTCLLHKSICHKIISDCSLIRVAMIDCAHVFPTSTEDSNYVFGLEKLKQFIQTILNDQIKLLPKN
nr:inositol polyphosphate multikinase isoform X1 [Parasteatoda tepidariorum]XP_042910266.1 inositol polyphosphate multikinase isoform X2 [Parasteatoda tepidariorum]XP_042910267.1 inositol polyphosphate multikinase isoform X1 [Parasteatoda tepidariorum]XP_042910268.1 inositol polyphosphate multikinase isoform X1 [Parasteatoda tepidariorum]